MKLLLLFVLLSTMTALWHYSPRRQHGNGKEPSLR